MNNLNVIFDTMCDCAFLMPLCILAIYFLNKLYKNNRKAERVKLSPEIYQDVSDMLKVYDSYKPWNRPDKLKMIRQLAEKYNQPDKTIIRWIQEVRKIQIKQQRVR